MQVIFGEEQKKLVEERFTVLELETFFEEGMESPVTAYCVIGFSDVPLAELPTMDNYVRMHAALMKEYREKNWSFCHQALEHLTGKWNGEVDSFYAHMKEMVTTYEQTGVPDGWDGTVYK